MGEKNQVSALKNPFQICIFMEKRNFLQIHNYYAIELFVSEINEFEPRQRHKYAKTGFN